MSSVIQHVRAEPQFRKSIPANRNISHYSVQSGIDRCVHAQLVLAAHRAGYGRPAVLVLPLPSRMLKPVTHRFESRPVHRLWIDVDEGAGTLRGQSVELHMVFI